MIFRQFYSVISITTIILLAGCKSKEYNLDLRLTDPLTGLNCEIETLLYEDNFDKQLSNWQIEVDSTGSSMVYILNESLIIDVDRGATVWLKKKLTGNILIQYNREVLMEDGSNDRLSDLNQFWMAKDPENKNLFTRNGTFNQYHNLALYYFGIGGNNNTTSRMRKYSGTGERLLLNDFDKEELLLKPNTTYHIQTLFYEGLIKVYVNNKEYFTYFDASPYMEGFFGLRTTKSRQRIDNLKVYKLK